MKGIRKGIYLSVMLINVIMKVIIDKIKQYPYGYWRGIKI